MLPTLRRLFPANRPFSPGQLIRALVALRQETTREITRSELTTERSITEVRQQVTVLTQIIEKNDLTAMNKFRQTKANPVTHSGDTKATLLDLTTGTAILTPDDMAIGREYKGEAYMLVSYDSDKPYSLFLSIGGQEAAVNVPVATTGLVENVMVRLSWRLVFYGGPDTDRECYFVGKYELIDNESDFIGSYHRRIPVTTLQVDATQPQPFDLLFQGTDSANSCTTIDIFLEKK